MGASMADIKSIFGHAMALSSPAERAAYLQQACGGDADSDATKRVLFDKGGRDLNLFPSFVRC